MASVPELEKLNLPFSMARCTAADASAENWSSMGERDAAPGELDVADLLALHVEHGDDGHHAVARELLAIAQDDGVGVADAQAVDVDDAGLHGVPALDAAAAHLERIAVVDHEDVLGRDTHLLAQRGVSTQVHGLAVDGHEERRLGERQHELELLLARMARHVHEGTALVVHVAAELGQAVDDLLHGLLVAGGPAWRR